MYQLDRIARNLQVLDDVYADRANQSSSGVVIGCEKAAFFGEDAVHLQVAWANAVNLRERRLRAVADGAAATG